MEHPGMVIDTSVFIDFLDIFIAATCIINNLPIKTLNKNHFNRIIGLSVN